jgi:hypothetical protein
MLRRGVPLATAALVTALAGCGSEKPDHGVSPAESATSPTMSASSDSSEPTPPSMSATPSTTSPSPTAQLRPSAVYFLEDTRTGLRLARERRELEGPERAQAAVAAMIAGPEDPDYATTWNPRTKVRSVTRNGAVVEVDLSPAARTANVGGEAAERMVQQLVYTATEAVGAPKGKVRLLIAGQPAGELWGAVTWDRPVGRADPASVRVLVQIDTPGDDVSVSSPLIVSGEANAFEATVPWQVLDATGKVVRKGFTTAREGMTFSPYTFKVKLPPGHYTVEVHEDDPSGGEGGPPMVDTKRITVG